MNNIDNFSPETKRLLIGLYSHISKSCNVDNFHSRNNNENKIEYNNENKVENKFFSEETRKLDNEMYLIFDIINEIRHEDIFIGE